MVKPLRCCPLLCLCVLCPLQRGQASTCRGVRQRASVSELRLGRGGRRRRRPTTDCPPHPWPRLPPAPRQTPSDNLTAATVFFLLNHSANVLGPGHCQSTAIQSGGGAAASCTKKESRNKWERNWKKKSVNKQRKNLFKEKKKKGEKSNRERSGVIFKKKSLSPLWPLTLDPPHPTPATPMLHVCAVLM